MGKSDFLLPSPFQNRLCHSGISGADDGVSKYGSILAELVLTEKLLADR